MQLYAVGTTGDGSAATPLLTSAVTTDAHGDFDVTGKYTCPSPSTLVYITGSGGNPGLPAGMSNPSLSLMAALGPCGNLSASTVIVINELTTVAAIWPLAPFTSSFSAVGSSPSDAPALASAFTLAEAYADTSSGTVPGLNVPSGTAVPVTEINTLADVLATCTNSAGGTAGDGSPCGALFAAATPTGETAPTNVIGAAINIATNPTINVSSIFALVQPTAPFQPALAAAPPNWVVQLATTAAGGLLVSPATLTFPATYLSFPSTPMTVSVNNTATNAIALTGISIVGLNASDFSLTASNCPYAAPGVPCNLQIVFTPSAVGARSASMLITSSGANSSLSVPLTGVGLALSGGPVTLSPLSLTFALAGIPQTVTVTNNGSIPVAIGNIVLTEPSEANYITITGFSQTNNCGTMLDAQSICTISVQVPQLQAGQAAYTGTLAVTDSSISNIQTVQLNGPSSIVTFPAAPLNFGDWALGDSTDLGISITGAPSSSTPINVSTQITGPNSSDFSLSPNTTGCHGLATQCFLDIVFTPSGLGTRTAMVVTNYGNVALSGNGLPVGPGFSITPSPLNLPGIPAGYSSTGTVFLNNNGNTQVKSVGDRDGHLRQPVCARFMYKSASSTTQ